jgi:capsular exopolysaccharide synthesis family protein
MSRIHEALKKATQERAGMPAADNGALPPEAPPAVNNWTPSAAPAVLSDLAAGNGSQAAVSAGYLRFEDLRARCSHPTWHLDPNVNVFFNTHLSPHAAEQFRTLRTRLYQLRSNQSLRTILVTSALAGEGKTFVANNLAQAIVHQPDRRALIIDADLRCARLHLPLGAPSGPGLADYLQGKADEMSIIQHGQEGNLCFIPAGSEVTNPSELLSNGRLKKLLDHVAPVFDWVILDSPPCVPVADASILATLCDGIVLVVRAGSTPTHVAQRACQELHGRNLVGVVLNAIDESNLNSSHYYQADGYGYGHGKIAAKELRQ